MKGVILAGGTGSRLFPLTKVTNKHLLPVYNKPMIYYPIECMVKAGIEEVLLVTGGNNSGDFIRLLGNGREFGLKNLNYTYQDGAGGIAQALGLAEHFAEGDSICLILGDNIVEYSIRECCKRFRHQGQGAKILLSQVENPSAYGVAEMNGESVTSIIEKPKEPKTNWAVIGMYFYDNKVFEIVKTLKPSARNELEITDVNNAYIQRGEMTADKVSGWWADAGENIDFYLQACNKVAESGANKEVIIGVNHVQVNVAHTELERARAFYIGFMGFTEIARPTTFKSKGIWMHAGSFEMHIGVEDGVDRSATRAHVAYEVNDIATWRKKVGDAGYELVGQPLIPGYDRFQFRDPFGNNIEIISRTKTG